MFNLNYGKSGTYTAIALLMGITAIVPFYPLQPATAQLLPQPSRNSTPSSGTVAIPAGTRIPMMFDDGEKILVSETEIVPLTLKTAATVRDGNRNVLIPAGSDVVGEIRPARGGSQFVSREIIINGQTYPFYSNSAVVTTTETINEGASIGEILGGTVAGAGAAAIIAAVTGDNNIDALEVLAGAAVGTLAGWGLPEAGIIGGGQREVISIDPNQDLTVTLQSSFSVANNNYRGNGYRLSFF
ncbi:hypothetical protein [Crocosphaera sp. XPORK-15E]|uniref:hypothetical protein n=1 Tax=Crocosphaera sp. XPORK-15E TaxID=3110247 RepID=UPI002B2017AA|nr:hypothetical protein [Crocosphaera sp. XPORK-15E]MEA5537297.1 hypothetical protein [Crocosphaera sp. XPORK-15E]